MAACLQIAKSCKWRPDARPKAAPAGRRAGIHCKMLTAWIIHQDIDELHAACWHISHRRGGCATAPMPALAASAYVDDELGPAGVLRQTTPAWWWMTPTSRRAGAGKRHAEEVASQRHAEAAAKLRWRTVSLAQALANCAGAARDSVGASHALLGCLRALAQPARYVSGYLSLADGGGVAHHNRVELWRMASGPAWTPCRSPGRRRPCQTGGGHGQSWTPCRFTACAGPAWKALRQAQHRRNNNRQIVHHAVFVPISG